MEPDKFELGAKTDPEETGAERGEWSEGGCARPIYIRGDRKGVSVWKRTSGWRSDAAAVTVGGRGRSRSLKARSGARRRAG
jgi:hypothetical protein